MVRLRWRWRSPGGFSRIARLALERSRDVERAVLGNDHACVRLACNDAIDREVVGIVGHIDAGQREAAPLDQIIVLRSGDGVQIGDLHIAAELQLGDAPSSIAADTSPFHAQASRSQRQVRRLRDVWLQDRQVERIEIERERCRERLKLQLAAGLQQRIRRSVRDPHVTFIFEPRSLLNPATVTAIGVSIELDDGRNGTVLEIGPGVRHANFTDGPTPLRRRCSWRFGCILRRNGLRRRRRRVAFASRATLSDPSASRLARTRAPSTSTFSTRSERVPNENCVPRTRIFGTTAIGCATLAAARSATVKLSSAICRQSHIERQRRMQGQSIRACQRELAIHELYGRLALQIAVDRLRAQLADCKPSLRAERLSGETSRTSPGSRPRRTGRRTGMRSRD